MEKLLIFFLNGLGDAFMFLPALRALQKDCEGNMAILTSSSFSNSYLTVMQAFAPGAEIIDLPATRENDKIIPDYPRFKEVCAGYTAFVNANEWPLPEHFRVEEYGSHFTRHVSFHPESQQTVKLCSGHMIDNYFSLARAFSTHCRLEDFIWPPETDSRIRKMALMTWGRFKQPGKRLVVHTDSQPEKMWDDGHYEQLLKQMLRDTDLNIIVTGMRKPEFITALPPDRITTAINTQFRLGWALLAEADYFIGIDSVFLHIADLYPTVSCIGLFGPTNPQVWGFRLNRSAVNLRAANGDINSLTEETVYNNFKTSEPWASGI